jgi:catalase-peroxidase
MLVDRAQLLTLSAPEMTALVGGLRVLGANTDDSSHGVFTDNVGALSNDFFVNLLDLDTDWSSVGAGDEMFEGRDRASGELKWTGTRNDLVFGSNSQLRAISEIYGSSDSSGRFVNAFVAAWDKVMTLIGSTAADQNSTDWQQPRRSPSRVSGGRSSGAVWSAAIA